MAQQETQEHMQNISSSVHVTMTLEEFLENDVEGFEYVKGELVPLTAASRRHGRISINIIRYLDRHVYKNKLGQLFTAETSFKVGERVLKPDVAFVASEHLDVDEDKDYQFHLILQLKWFHRQMSYHMLLVKYMPI